MTENYSEAKKILSKILHREEPGSDNFKLSYFYSFQLALMEQDPAADSLLAELIINLPEHPGSVPINQLVKVEGTPLDGEADIEAIEFVRTIATARILMPRSWVRLSAGRNEMTDEMQALCFFAGAKSIFYGEKLLTTGNPDTAKDDALFSRLGLHPA